MPYLILQVFNLDFHILHTTISYLIERLNQIIYLYIKYTINKMSEVVIDNIFTVTGNIIFQHTIGKLITKNYTPLTIHVFPYSHEAEFMHTLVKSKYRFFQI